MAEPRSHHSPVALKMSLLLLNWRLQAIRGYYWLAPRGALAQTWGHRPYTNAQFHPYAHSNTSPTPTPMARYPDAKSYSNPKAASDTAPRPTP